MIRDRMAGGLPASIHTLFCLCTMNDEESVERDLNQFNESPNIYQHNQYTCMHEAKKSDAGINQFVSLNA
jgi:hypothetical protein